MSPLDAFAADIGGHDRIACRGGGTRWSAGGLLSDDVRLVHAPSGIVSHEPSEMTVRVFAGTLLSDLRSALGEHRQTVAIDAPSGATVGGALMVGEENDSCLGHGPMRDSLLQATYVAGSGELVTAGGPTVKNVSGFDLCRLLVGSLGTLGIVGEVILRTRPVPPASRWLIGHGDPFALRRQLFHPAAILWDGETIWVKLEGHPSDLDSEIARRLPGFIPVAGPPAERPPFRWSLAPRQLRDISRMTGGAGFVAHIGVGLVECELPQPARPVDLRLQELHAEVKRRLDPTGRFSPGRSVL